MNPDQVGDYSEEEQPQSKVGIVTAIYRLFRSDTEQGAIVRKLFWDLASFGLIVGTATFAVPAVTRYLEVTHAPNTDDFVVRSKFKDEADYFTYRALYNA